MSKPVKQPSGKYRLRYYAGLNSEGKKVYVSFTCDTPGQCNKAAKDWVKNGGKIIEKPQARNTVKKAVENYIKACKENKRKSYSPSTIAGYEKTLRNYPETFLGKAVDQIRISDIQDLIDEMFNSDKSVKTIKNAVYLLKPSLDKEQIVLNYKELELPEQEEEEYIIPTDEEIQSILQITEGKNPQLYQAIVLAAFCGLRRSEICALTWGDIDRQKMTIHIDKAVVLDEVNICQTKDTKTRAGKRDVKIDESILYALDIRQRVDGVVYGPSASLTGLTPNTLTSRWNRLKKSMGFKFCFHSLRHYQASVMVALDLPKKYIIERMGHATNDMVDKVYAQVIKDKEKAVSDAINGYASTILSGKKYKWG